MLLAVALALAVTCVPATIANYATFASLLAVRSFVLPFSFALGSSCLDWGCSFPFVSALEGYVTELTAMVTLLSFSLLAFSFGERSNLRGDVAHVLHAAGPEHEPLGPQDLGDLFPHVVVLGVPLRRLTRGGPGEDLCDPADHGRRLDGVLDSLGWARHGTVVLPHQSLPSFQAREEVAHVEVVHQNLHEGVLGNGWQALFRRPVQVGAQVRTRTLLGSSSWARPSTNIASM